MALPNNNPLFSMANTADKTIQFCHSTPAGATAPPSHAYNVDQNPVISPVQLPTTCNIVTLNDSVFTPKPFTGFENDTEKVEQWLTYFETYVAFSNIDEQRRLQLFHLLMADGAADWLRSLDDGVKADYSRLITAFRKRYSMSDIDRCKKASALMTRAQGETESVASYITAVQNAARLVPVKDSNFLRYIVTRGLRPQIRLHVMQSSANDLESVIKAAKVAEAAIQASTPSSDVKDLTDQVSRLITKLDNPLQPVAVVDSHQRSEEEQRRVTFAPSRDRSSERRDNSRDRSMSPARRAPTPERRQGYNNGQFQRGERRFSESRPGQYQQSFRNANNGQFSSSRDTVQRQNFRPRWNGSARSAAPQQSSTCGNCLYSHSVNQPCRAANFRCFNCSRIGHSYRACRSPPYSGFRGQQQASQWQSRR
jgi:hypothetical protein